MANRIRARMATVPASSPAACALFLTATLGPMVIFAIVMRVVGG
jgi:hypothetical protein